MAPARPERGRRLRRLLLIALAAALGATTLLTGRAGMLAHWRLAGYRQELAERIAVRMEENHSLSTEVERLRSDPFTQEALARERLGMVRPGETVFLVPGEGPR